MSMTISRKLAVVNGLNDLLNEPLMPKELHVPASRVILIIREPMVILEIQFQIKNGTQVLLNIIYVCYTSIYENNAKIMHGGGCERALLCYDLTYSGREKLAKPLFLTNILN